MKTVKDFTAQLRQLEDEISYSFTNIDLLQESLTHPSYKTYGSDINYERLEFLGDALLGMIISEALYHHYPAASEGDLSKLLSYLVSGKLCSIIAQTIGINKALIISQAAEKSEGRMRESNLANALESLIAAIYLDGGMKNCKDFILRQWHDYLLQGITFDPKGELQEWAQAHHKGLPIYQLINTEGSDHAPLFTISVTIAGIQPLSATGTNKKDGEKKAAAKMLDYLYKNYK